MGSANTASVLCLNRGVYYETFLLQGAKKDTKKDSKAPAKQPKKKEGGGGGKAKKKKWSKGKTRDKLNNLVLFDKATYDKLLKEVPTYKLITPAIVSERLKVTTTYLLQT